MIHFDAVDFSERHYEEVISFFWRSVYFKCSLQGEGGGGRHSDPPSNLPHTPQHKFISI